MGVNIGPLYVFLILIEVQSYSSYIIFGLYALVVYYIIILSP